MANLSDAFGTILVSGVGKEFLEFLNTVQCKDVYYKLVEEEDYALVKPDKDNNIKFNFSTAGRWDYENNLEGYLEGDWMRGSDLVAWKKLINALHNSGGFIEVDYKDSDISTSWMGDGVAVLRVTKKGDVDFNNNFDFKDLTIKNYAEQQGFTEYDALEYIYGEEIADKYKEYYEQWYVDHEEGKPASPGEWFDNEYQEDNKLTDKELK